MKFSLSRTSAPAGFSLIELLVVISIIAVITSVALPGISNVSDQAKDTMHLRNAQTIVSMWNAVMVTGTTSLSSEEERISVLLAGTNVVIGNETSVFKIDGLSEGDITNAMRYISIDPVDGQNLIYHPEGGQ